MQKNRAITSIHFDKIASTNLWAKESAFILDPQKITFITASEQTAGYGTNKRRWHSPKEGNLYGTFFFSLARTFPFLQNLAQLLSISCAKILEQLGLFPEFKWPNDLRLKGKKVAGVLCETIDLEDRIGVILGIGLNVMMPKEQLQKIDQAATSIFLESLGPCSLPEIQHSLLQQFLLDLSVFELEGFSPFHSYYENRLCMKASVLSVETGTGIITGTCLGISKEGFLRLLLPSEKIVEISSGTILKNCDQE